MKEFNISFHALHEMDRRNIERDLVDSVLADPAQKVPELDNIVCYQSKVDIGGKKYLLRVMVNEETKPPVVVTVYRTSKINKYWRNI